MTSPVPGGLPPRPDDRLPGLDVLRGVAALVVVVFHALLVSPELADAFRTGTAPAGSAASWMLHTPAALIWMGTEAVMLFFVLSGFVLTLPFLRSSGGPPLRSYYPQRLVRLYVPVVGSLALAGLSYALLDHTARPGMSWWMAGHDIDPTLGTVLRDAVLLLGTGWFNSVHWSLRWEVMFSLVLPAMVFVIVRAGQARPVLWGLVAAGIVGSALVEASSAGYLLMFSIGSLLAAEQRWLRAVAVRLGRRSRIAWVCGSTLLLLVHTGSWWGGDFVLTPLTVTLGVTGVIVAFAWFPLGAAVARVRPLRWVGTRSFSLYLVHEPIVVSTALALRTSNPLLVAAVALPLSLVVAAVFFRCVEFPSWQLARRVGRRTRNRAADSAPEPGAVRSASEGVPTGSRPVGG
ncbi:acyltransferase family protein [Pseudonocardia alni]|uniref:acyltransferase family protein n=1 Tax=Pseudonocardia alni TaxID=33907 RepID=UPI0027A51A0F|nr:acyltransferase [Pseudonocardia alni]